MSVLRRVLRAGEGLSDDALGQRHCDVQMMGGAGVHFGWIAEMTTGDGANNEFGFDDLRDNMEAVDYAGRENLLDIR